jgi:hypothetical protein
MDNHCIIIQVLENYSEYQIWLHILFSNDVEARPRLNNLFLHEFINISCIRDDPPGHLYDLNI